MLLSHAEAPTLFAPAALVAPGPSSPRQRRSARKLFSAILRNDLVAARRAVLDADLSLVLSSSGETPLSTAIQARRPALVRLVADRLRSRPDSADVLAGGLAHLLAVWPRHPSQAWAEQACLEGLLGPLRLGALPQPAEGSWVALAMSSDNPGLVEALMDFGAPLDALGPLEETVLHLAVQNRAQALVDWALERGVSPNAPNANGETPLHNAVRCGNLGLADRLLAAGGDPDAANRWGQTPLSLAGSLGARGEGWRMRVRLSHLSSLLASDCRLSPATALPRL